MRNQLGNADDIDPARVDLAEAPKRPRHKRGKAKAPSWVEPAAEKAKSRMAERRPSPGVMLEPDDRDGYRAESPHDNHRAWDLQIHDAFGTRSASVARTFLAQLRQLVDLGWSEKDHRWKPNETQLNAALAFISGIKPRNEAEAALAAQMLAVHLMTMQVSANALKWGGHDARAAATAARLARTYAMQLDALARGRGKGKATRQKITVKRESHVHHHQHVHVGGGADDFGAQPHEPSEPDRPSAERAALPGAHAGGLIVPMPSRPRQGAVPDARRGKRLGGSDG